MSQSREIFPTEKPHDPQAPEGPAGNAPVLEHISEILKDNPCAIRTWRKLGVWAAAAIRRRLQAPLPVLYDLVGFTGSASPTPTGGLRRQRPGARGAAYPRGKMERTIFRPPGLLHRARGNQYVNSAAIGDYADYLTREIVPFVDREFRTLASASTAAASENHPAATARSSTA